MAPELPPPWQAFLSAVDQALPRPVALHCLGGFVLALRHGLPRPTQDVDYVEIVPADQRTVLEAVAGLESALARRHRVYCQHVTVASLPEAYEDRLTELMPGRFERLRLFGLDPYDLALSKLARNSPVDREDVAFLARVVPLEPTVLGARYRAELRPIIIGDVDRHDRTLAFWIEAYWR